MVLAIAACSAATNTGVRRSPNVITADEARETNQSTAYDVIRSQRPTWLRKRGVQSIHSSGDIVVYVDNARLGGPEVLNQINVSAIEEIRYFDAASATQRWGTGHSFGAIQVFTW